MHTEKRVYIVIIFLLLLLVVGTIIYSQIEKWSYIDSLYFSTTTLATVGLGDVHPVTNAGKLFTIGYIFVGVTASLYGFTLVAKHYFENNESRLNRALRSITNMELGKKRKDGDIRVILREIEEKEKSKDIKINK